MLRQALILFALACCFVLAPSTARPPSAWADTPVLDAGTTAIDAAPPVTVGSGSGSDAAPVVTPAKGSPADKATEDMLGTGKQIVDDIKGGNWRFAIAGILAVLFALGVRFTPRLFGKTQRGKAIAVMLLAVLATMSAALATSTAISPSLLVGAVGVAFTAVGGRNWIASLLWPSDSKGPQVMTWLQPVLGVKPNPPA